MTIHHIGIIVNNINNAIELYKRMGCKLTKSVVYDNIQNNWIAFMSHDFLPSIELIEPINESSSVYNFKKGYHHLCYEAELGEDIIHKFKTMRMGKIFTKPIIAPALNNREVVFACLKNGMFIEMIL